MCAATVACLHGHWGSQLRSLGLCGKNDRLSHLPVPNFLFKGVRTWRRFFLILFFFKVCFLYNIYLIMLFPTPKTSQVLQQTNKNPVRQKHQSQTKSQSVFASGMIWCYKFYKQKWPGLIWVSTQYSSEEVRFVKSWGLWEAADSPPYKPSALILSFSTSRTVKDRFLFFIKSPGYGTLLQYHK